MWSVVQDHVNANLLFAGTEFGLFATLDGGTTWLQLKDGLPTIQVRDMAVQKRESDLVLGTFGRGFYVLDDYSALRDMTPQSLRRDAAVPPSRRVSVLNRPGAARIGGTWLDGRNWTAPNPPFGAVFTYNVAGRPRAAAKLVLTITDDTGRQIRRLDVDRSLGLRRATWNLRVDPPPTRQPHLRRDDRSSASSGRPRQHHPTGRTGRYRATLGTVVGDTVTALGDPQTFSVVQVVQQGGTRDSALGIWEAASGTGDRGSGPGVWDSGLPRRSSTCTTRTEAVPGHAEAPDAQPERRRVASAFRRKIRRRRGRGNPGIVFGINGAKVHHHPPASIRAITGTGCDRSWPPAWLRSDLAV